MYNKTKQERERNIDIPNIFLKSDSFSLTRTGQFKQIKLFTIYICIC